jgi:hypothetical protein
MYHFALRPAGAKGRAVLAAGAALAALSVTACGAAGGTGASSTSSPPAASATAAPQPSATSATPDLSLPVKPTAAQVDAWAASTGVKEFESLESAMNGVASATGGNSDAKVTAACAKLTTVVRQAQAGPPFPDQSVEVDYADALSNFAAAGANCTAAVPGHNTGLMAKAGQELSAGATQFQKVDAALKQLG